MTFLPINAGVYYVIDEKLRLLPEEERKVHEPRRLVVVLSGSTTNSDSNWLFVIVCPISGSTQFKTKFCVKLAVGEGGVSKKCWIRIPAIQPIKKTDLEDRTGILDAKKLDEIHARLLQYMGLMDIP